MGFLPDLTRGFCWNREFTHGTNPIPRAQLDLVQNNPVAVESSLQISFHENTLLYPIVNVELLG